MNYEDRGMNLKALANGRNAETLLAQILSEKIRQCEETKRYLIVAVVTLFIFSGISINECSSNLF